MGEEEGCREHREGRKKNGAVRKIGEGGNGNGGVRERCKRKRQGKMKNFEGRGVEVTGKGGRERKGVAE